jgi:hypothetical protein
MIRIDNVLEKKQVNESLGNASLAIYDPAYKLLSGMPKPEFMLIGGAKCGTTSFSSYLPVHPQVKSCDVKEPNFWSWKHCTKQDYQSYFVNQTPLSSPRPDQRIGGEYSTSSLLHPLVPRRIRGRLPDLKIIILLRNPIDRAYSHFIMSRQRGFEQTHSFDEIVRKEIDEVPVLLEAHQRGFLDSDYRTRAHCTNSDGSLITVSEHNEGWARFPLKSDNELLKFYFTSYVFRSLYHDQLWRWLYLFPRKQFLILQAEKFFENTRKTMGQVAEFLNLQPFDFDSDELKCTWGGGVRNVFGNPGDYDAMRGSTRDLLKDFFTSHNDKLFELIGDRYNWE